MKIHPHESRNQHSNGHHNCIRRELELRQLSNQAFVINETRKFCQLFTSNSGISSMLSMLSSYTDSIILITDYNDKSVYFHIPDSYANLLQTSSRVVILTCMYR